MGFGHVLFWFFFHLTQHAPEASLPRTRPFLASSDWKRHPGERASLLFLASSQEFWPDLMIIPKIVFISQGQASGKVRVWWEEAFPTRTPPPRSLEKTWVVFKQWRENGRMRREGDGEDHVKQGLFFLSPISSLPRQFSPRSHFGSFPLFFPRSSSS